MANPVPCRFPGASRRGARASTLIAFTAMVLGAAGCSINLSSLSPPSAPEREETPQVTSSSNIGSLSEAIKNNPNMVINVNGYCDSIGSAEYNLKLSQRRAEAVAN